MPKIKNWSKTKERGSSVTWENDRNGKTRIILSKNDNSRNMKWQVMIDRMNTDQPIMRETFKTKEDARSWATSWMKNHPMG